MYPKVKCERCQRYYGNNVIKKHVRICGESVKELSVDESIDIRYNNIIEFIELLNEEKNMLQALISLKKVVINKK